MAYHFDISEQNKLQSPVAGLTGYEIINKILHDAVEIGIGWKAQTFGTRGINLARPALNNFGNNRIVRHGDLAQNKVIAPGYPFEGFYHLMHGVPLTA